MLASPHRPRAGGNGFGNQGTMLLRASKMKVQGEWLLVTQPPFTGAGPVGRQNTQLSILRSSPASAGSGNLAERGETRRLHLFRQRLSFAAFRSRYARRDAPNVVSESSDLRCMRFVKLSAQYALGTSMLTSVTNAHVQPYSYSFTKRRARVRVRAGIRAGIRARVRNLGLRLEAALTGGKHECRSARNRYPVRSFI